MNELSKLLSKADFSKETDLKERLYNQLFGSKIVQFPTGRQALSEDDLDMVSAAGDKTQPEKDLLK